VKKSNIAAIIAFFVLIPLTLYMGTFFSGRAYYVTGTLIIIEMLIPFLMAFEGKKPQTKELVVIAVMCAIAIIGRVAIPIPNFKASFAIIMLAGIAFGPETGFMVGAITALVSNFFYGQGVYMPWQMMGYGAGGLLAGFIFKKGLLPRKKIYLSIAGFLIVVLWVGPLLDCSHLFLMMPELNLSAVIASLLSGLPINLSQAVSTVIVMLLFGNTILEKLDRVKLKYGMLED